MIAHVYALAANMREKDQREVAATGMSPKAVLRRCFRSSVLCKTAFVDGEIACMWGLSGTLVSDVGHPFLLTTAAVERAPLALIKIGKIEVQRMLRLRAQLWNYVAADYAGAIGLLRILGFRLGSPVPMGVSGAPFCKFELSRAEASRTAEAV